MNLPIRISGIPALAHIHSYHPAEAGRYSGPPEHCYPAEPADLEWEVLDRRGRAAPWLERKLTDATRETLTAELIERVERVARDYAEAAAEDEWERRHG